MAETEPSFDAELDAELRALLEAEDLNEARWRVLGEINNRLVSRYHPDHLAIWWREPNDELGGRTPESIASGEFDPQDPLVQRLLELARAKEAAAPRPQSGA
jgi:hypothetical protein